MMQNIPIVPTTFRPMLAAKVESDADLKKLRTYPYMVSPKLDGIRILLHPQKGPVTRKVKALPNDFTFKSLCRVMGSIPEMCGYDGEITVGTINNIVDPDIFTRTTSAVMSHGGEPETTFWIFDNFLERHLPFHQRYDNIVKIFPKMANLKHFGVKMQLAIVPQYFCHTEADLLAREQNFVSQGFEGIMIRRKDGAYKFGRSTLVQQDLIKIKRFEDAEGIVVGFEELMRNNNPDQKDAFGLAKRSTHKDNMIGGGLLGSLKVKVINGIFKDAIIGLSGFDDTMKQGIWDNRDHFMGKTVTFKYQRSGSKDAPRFPIFKGFRATADLELP